MSSELHNNSNDNSNNNMANGRASRGRVPPRMEGRGGIRPFARAAKGRRGRGRRASPAPRMEPGPEPSPAANGSGAIHTCEPKSTSPARSSIRPKVCVTMTRIPKRSAAPWMKKDAVGQSRAANGRDGVDESEG